MRKFVGAVLVFVGVTSLVIAAVAAFWTSDKVQKTPLDTDNTTLAAGTASLSGAAAVPVKAIQLSRADSSRSTSDVIVFNSSSCLVIVKGETPNCLEATDPEGRLLSASSEIFATDRHTGEAVNDPKILPADAEEKHGLVNKWPFGAKKQDYKYWDDLSEAEVPAVYSGTAKIDGMETYVFKVDVEDAPIEIASGVPGLYSSSKTISIDPRTGAIIKQTEKQERVADDGSPVLALDFGMTKGQVADNVADAKDNIARLDLVSKTVPIVGVIVGLLALIAGVLVQTVGRRSADPQHAEVQGAVR
ncbi:MAG: hypothetical protein JWR55_3018 [Aeromicrobium sp.]|jgi:hypothetical protein|nr:hypothetical protein [Aeromicrobium sp.]